MPLTEKDEKKVLSKSEYNFVQRTRSPAVDELNAKELRELSAQIRRYRDKAKDVAHSQRREMRGKAAPRGAMAAASNDGQSYKRQIFANALKRVNRRLDAAAADKKRKHDLKAAQKALKSRQAMLAEREAKPIPGKDGALNKGPTEITNPKGPALINPMERGRVSQFVKNAQAKRDS